MADPVHLCHLLPNMDLGGVSSNVLEVCNGLNTDDFMTSCLCVNHRGVAAERVEPRVQVWALHAHERGQPGPAEVLRLADLMRRYAVDVLHIHGIGWYYPAGALAARLAGVGHVLLTEHQLGRATLDAPWGVGLLPASRHLTDRFTATSPAVARALAENLHIPAEQIPVIPTGIDLQKFRPPRDGDPARSSMGIRAGEVVLGAAGRVTEQSGHDVLLEAVASLHSAGAALRLVVVGKGPHRAHALRRVHQLGLQQVVTMVETVADMPAFYAALDVFVAPGRHEGISSAVLEAMASGLPVVAANAGANMEAVKDGETGMLVPEHNAAILARILADLVEDRSRRETLGQRARRHVEEHHRAETMVQRHSALYHGLDWNQIKEDPS